MLTIASFAGTTGEPLSMTAAIFWVLVGILISLLLPIAVETLRKAQGETQKTRVAVEEPAWWQKAWQKIVRAWEDYGGITYLKILAAATFVAIVLVVLLGLKFTTIREAAMAGFGWESFLKKLTGSPGGE